MGKDRFDTTSEARRLADRPCWREILDGALAGVHPPDFQIEKMLDHLERKQ